MAREGLLILEDGTEFPGTFFGAEIAAAGEVVFTTGMVGYPESLTDPSYAGQILVATYPLVGNYGVPGDEPDALGLPAAFESERVQVSGLVIANLGGDVSHPTARRSLDDWLREAGVPGLEGVDTRALAQRLRDRGTMLGKLVPAGEDIAFFDPHLTNLVARVSHPERMEYGRDGPRIVLVDTGAKASIVRCLVRAGARVLRVPWDDDFLGEHFDGVLLPNGPGDPKMAAQTVEHVRRAMASRVPIFGICLGNQLLALAAGADTYKLKFGHRSQNQPCLEVGTRRCYVTSQNHGYAVSGATLPDGWREWFLNANDGTNEGIRHEYRPLRSVQFHPEAAPGPTDTVELFRRFLEMVG
ncbi:MAG: glutamine-hydrolyzing carbamoyl-phosphate synthase small subunit [Planctomycetes bacterium]|nr:glutamine-hydrolyzing carbamoyl-phosphate synthase small subunit [Planctomycetota bacterium]